MAKWTGAAGAPAIYVLIRSESLELVASSLISAIRKGSLSKHLEWRRCDGCDKHPKALGDN